MRDERFKFIFLMGIHIFILELLIMEHFINGTNLTEMSFKIPSGGTSAKWKLYKSISKHRLSGFI